MTRKLRVKLENKQNKSNDNDAVNDKCRSYSDICERFKAFRASDKLHIGQDEVVAVSAVFEELGDTQCHVDKTMYKCGDPAFAENTDKSGKDKFSG